MLIMNSFKKFANAMTNSFGCEYAVQEKEDKRKIHFITFIPKHVCMYDKHFFVKSILNIISIN